MIQSLLSQSIIHDVEVSIGGLQPINARSPNALWQRLAAAALMLTSLTIHPTNLARAEVKQVQEHVRLLLSS